MRLQPKATVIQKCLAPTTDAQLSKSGLNLVELAWELCALRATSHFLTAARKRREPCVVAVSRGESGRLWGMLLKRGGDARGIGDGPAIGAPDRQLSPAPPPPNPGPQSPPPP